MLIRSQDKTTIVVIEGIDSICIVLQNSEYFVRSYNGNTESSCALGRYKSEDEAIRALNDICDTYQYLKECEVTGVGKQNPSYVYYMPD